MEEDIIRRFNPIGQGAFYEENFYHNNFNFVYDCGSKTDEKIVENIIKRSTYKKIDLLVISHFDQDHISNIKTLLKNKTITVLMIPYLTNEEKLLTFIEYIEESKCDEQEDAEKIFSLIYKTKEHFGENNIEKLIEIKPNIHGNYDEEVTSLGKLKDNDTVISGTRLNSDEISKSEWVYIPFVLNYL